MIREKSPVQFPVETESLEFFLPHRKPMRWIDKILSADFAGNGTCCVKVSQNALMTKEARVFPAALIEFIAQSYGYLKALEAKNKEGLAIASLAAIDSFEIFAENLPAEGSEVKIEIKTLNDLHPIYLIEGSVLENDREICRGKLKCFALFKGEQWDFQ